VFIRYKIRVLYKKTDFYIFLRQTVQTTFAQERTLWILHYYSKVFVFM